MLFHLFIFFSHMNWSIHSYSAGKLTTSQMIHHRGGEPERAMHC